MPISGKTIQIPAQEFSLYWLADLRVTSLSPNEVEPVFRATLKPYYVDSDSKIVFAQNKDIVLSIPNFNTFAEAHPDVGAAIATVLSSIEQVAKAQGLI